MLPELLVCVTNYEFNSNAIALKQFFGKHFRSIIIDSSTPGGFPEADVIIPNRYYPGLWEEALQQALNRQADWLLFIASDVQLIEADLTLQCILEATSNSNIQLWTPSVTHSSRASFKSTLNKNTAGMRHCGVPEGFCFLARTSLLKQFHPIPASNHYGWHIDVATAMRAHELGDVVVDDRMIIHHPPKKTEHSIDSGKAFNIGSQYLKNFGYSRHLLTKVRQLEFPPKGKSNPLSIKQQRSLDLGCGSVPQDPFATGHAVGIDITNPENRSDITTSDLFIKPIPHADSSFEYITALNFLQLVPRLTYLNNERRFCFIELMDEIHRVLKPGGIFASLTPAFPNRDAIGNPTHVNLITETTFPDFFCLPNPQASSYGFEGKFHLIHQSQKSEGKLLTLMRAIKVSTPNGWPNCHQRDCAGGGSRDSVRPTSNSTIQPPNPIRQTTAITSSIQ